METGSLHESGLEPFDESGLEDLMDELAVFQKDSVDASIARVGEDDAVASDAQSVVYGEICLKRPDIAAIR